MKHSILVTVKKAEEILFGLLSRCLKTNNRKCNMSDIKYKPSYRQNVGDFTNSFIRQRRNLMGISIVVILYYFLGAKITNTPTIWGAIEITKIRYVEVIIFVLFFYYTVRMIVYQRLEKIKFWFEFLEILNRNSKFRGFIKQKFEKMQPKSIVIQGGTLIFILFSRFEILCIVTHYQNSVSKNIQKQIETYSCGKKSVINQQTGLSSQYVSTSIHKIIIPFLKTFLSPKFLFGSCFTDFCLPWLLWVIALGFLLGGFVSSIKPLF